MLKLGKGGVFFELLNKQAAVAEEAAQELLKLVGDLGNRASHTKKLAEIEHRGDDLTHELQNKVAATFIPPIDQEDLNELSNVLDDITDFIEATGARIDLYHLSEPRMNLIPMATQLVECTKLVKKALEEMSDRIALTPSLRETLTQIHTVENESDNLFRAALGSLFDEPGIDALTVIKWKEVYDRIETAVDRCEDVAKTIDNLVVKYA